MLSIAMMMSPPSEVLLALHDHGHRAALDARALGGAAFEHDLDEIPGAGGSRNSAATFGSTRVPGCRATDG